VTSRPLETPRLLLRRWRDDDLDGLAAITAQPEVMRHLHDGRPMDRAATAERVMSLERETVQPDTGRTVRVYAMDV
jgi:RimJ/RimL family protein N-acetyltransferase